MNRFVGEDELALLREVIESQVLYRGGWRGAPARFAERFEAEFGAYLGREHVLAVNTGTSALQAALAGAGVGPGDEVIVTSASFIASSTCVLALDAVPVFADVDPATFNLDPADVARKITPRTKAVIPVHLYGQLCDMDAIMRLAAQHDLIVIEDCAQAFAWRHLGRLAGTIGHVGAFSLQQSKHITTGEGGIVATDDRALYERASRYANLGFNFVHDPTRAGAPYSHFALGWNLRMGELAAAVAVAQLPKLEEFNRRRQRLVEAIEGELRGGRGLRLPEPIDGAEPVYFFYPIRYDPAALGVPKDEFLARVRAEHGVAVGPYPPVPNHLEPVYTSGAYRQGYPPGVRWHPDQPPPGPGLLPRLERALPETLITVTFHHGDDPETYRALARALRATAESLAAVRA
jgi:dTDP-4-amino-4,6-dideoxygalactose transaminase